MKVRECLRVYLDTDYIGMYVCRNVHTPKLSLNTINFFSQQEFDFLLNFAWSEEYIHEKLDYSIVIKNYSKFFLIK